MSEIPGYSPGYGKSSEYISPKYLELVAHIWTGAQPEFDDREGADM